MKRHYAKECRASIEVVTPNTAICSICEQTYHYTRHYGKSGWQRNDNDDRLLAFIRQHEKEYIRQ